MIVTAYNTGMRPGEIKELKWSYIDRKAVFIRLPEEATKEKSAKDIPINHHVKTVLDSVPRAINHDFVFTLNGGPIRYSQTALKMFRAACKRAGVPYGRKTQDGITFHDMRRTVKTNMLEAGVDKVYRDKILGHSLTGMDVHYLAPSENTLKNVMEKYTAWLDEKIAHVNQTVNQRTQIA